MGITFNPFTGTLDFTGGAGGGGGTPSAPDTSVQFNDGGSFGGDSSLVWDKATQQLQISSFSSTGSLVGAITMFPFTDPTGLVNQELVGIFNSCDTDGDSTYSNIIGENTHVNSASSGAVANLVGHKVEVQSGDGADVTAARGLVVQMDTVDHATETIEAIFINGGWQTGGTATNAIGLKIEDVTYSGATINYAIDVNSGFRVGPDGVNVFLANGGALRTDGTIAHTALIQAFDVDGAAYKTFATLTNGNVPRFTISQPAGGLLAIIAPTTDPGVTGALWNDNGAPAFSA